MRESHRRTSECGYEGVRFELGRRCTWSELVRIMSAIVMDYRIGSFCIYARPSKIGATGFSAASVAELPEFVGQAIWLGEGDLSGFAWIDGVRHDFYLGNTRSVGFAARGAVNRAVPSIVSLAEASVLSRAKPLVVEVLVNCPSV